MKRKIFSALEAWKKSPWRKPMLLIGARQTGKSWILREFGEKAFDHYVLCDFEEETPRTQKISQIIAE